MLVYDDDPRIVNVEFETSDEPEPERNTGENQARTNEPEALPKNIDFFAALPAEIRQLATERWLCRQPELPTLNADALDEYPPTAADIELFHSILPLPSHLINDKIN